MMSGSKVQQYKQFAQVYDEFLAHVDYPMWANYIIDLWQAKNSGLPKRILDIACGTGELMGQFAKDNIPVMGIDISAEMINIAISKLSHLKPEDSQIIVGDIRNFCLSEQFDMVVCAFDSVNYMTDLNELSDVFSNTYDSLTADGMFVFDVATPFLCEKYYGKTSEKQQYGDKIVERKSEWNSRTQNLITEFTFQDFKNDSVNKEVHVQKIFSSQDLVPLLKKTGFRRINIYSDFSFEPVNEKTLRIHYSVEK